MALMNKPQKGLEEKIKKFGRYSLASFLPEKVQKGIARKHGENPKDYWIGTTASEVIVGNIVLIVGAATGCIPVGAVGLCILWDSAMNGCRGFTYLKKPCGHPITTIPYHLVKQPYNLGKYVKNKILNKRGKK